MRLTKNDYKLLIYLILLLFLCWGTRFILLIRPETSFPLTPKWQIDLGNSTYERPAYQDGLVLFPASFFLSSHWYGIEAVTGREVWSQRDGWWYKSFRHCLTSEYLVISGLSSFITLETRTGNIIWTEEKANTATCSESSVFAILPRSDTRAFDLSTGREIWSGTNPLQPFRSLIYNPETDELIAGGAVVVDPISGRILRSFEPRFVGYPPEESGRGPAYLIDRGQLFSGGTVRDAQTGQVIHKEDFYGTNTPPTVTADTMYLSSGYAVVAFDRATYTIKWVYPAQPNFGGWVPVYTISPVAILDGVGYVIYSDATLRAFDLQTGQEVGYWQPGLFDRLFWPVCVPFPFPLCTNPTGVGMTTSEDTLFVSFGDGKLYAFGK